MVWRRISSSQCARLANACAYILDNGKAELPDLLQFVQGPDFPTEAEIITPKADIVKLYETGKGSIKMRAVYTEESGDIVITALPHQCSGAKVLEQIAAQMTAKKLPKVTDLRDESDHENPVRLVITPSSNRVDMDEIMMHLFATTDLEKNYRVNLNMIGLNARQVKNRHDPQRVVGIPQGHRDAQIAASSRQSVARLHILEGLLIAFLNIDELFASSVMKTSPKKS